jgi:hypothetical protein
MPNLSSNFIAVISIQVANEVGGKQFSVQNIPSEFLNAVLHFGYLYCQMLPSRILKLLSGGYQWMTHWQAGHYYCPL